MSKYWKHYTKLNHREASCDLCSENSISKIIRTAGNTTNLKQHLKGKHPKFFEAIEKLRKKKLKKDGQDTISSDDSNSINVGSEEEKEITNANADSDKVSLFKSFYLT